MVEPIRVLGGAAWLGYPPLPGHPPRPTDPTFVDGRRNPAPIGADVAPADVTIEAPELRLATGAISEPAPARGVNAEDVSEPPRAAPDGTESDELERGCCSPPTAPL